MVGTNGFMPNIRSAIKRMRVTARHTEVNRGRRSRVRTLVKKTRLAIANNDEQAARVSFKQVEPELQRAARKGIFHQKTVSRMVSRLNKAIKNMAQK